MSRCNKQRTSILAEIFKKKYVYIYNPALTNILYNNIDASMKYIEKKNRYKGERKFAALQMAKLTFFVSKSDPTPKRGGGVFVRASFFI